MGYLRVALSFFPRTKVRYWPGLAYYFTGWLLNRLAGWRLFAERTVHIGNLVVSVDVEGRGGLMFLYEIMVQNIYDFPPASDAGKVRVLFDAGANCGFYTLTASHRWSTVRAFCFEPHPATFERLSRNIQCNGLQDSVTPVHAAVGATSGTCTLEVSGSSSMGVVASSPRSATESARTVQVPMLALDDFANSQGQFPDLIKIDVEGFEVEVLKGARQCLNHARFVILEVHSDELATQTLAVLHAAAFQTERRQALIFASK